jgi:FMN-dependent NADH-azoreductase
MAAMDHQESLLRSAFGMMGIEQVTIVRAEGIAMGTEYRNRAMAGAEARIRAMDTNEKAA